MLIIVAYLVVGNTLSTADLVVKDQKEITILHGVRQGTEIQMMMNPPTYPAYVPYQILFVINNSGNYAISDFTHMDLFTTNTTLTGFQRYTYSASSNPVQDQWTIVQFDRDYVHPKILDPGEAMWICATVSSNTKPDTILVSTSNAVVSSTTIP